MSEDRQCEDVVDQRERGEEGSVSVHARVSQRKGGWEGILVIYDPETNLSREKKKDRSRVEGKSREEASVGDRLVKSLALLLPGRDV